MICPRCAKHDTRVVKTLRPVDESRLFPYGQLKRRDRVCRDCSSRFRTFEIHERQFRTLVRHLEGGGK